MNDSGNHHLEGEEVHITNVGNHQPQRHQPPSLLVTLASYALVIWLFAAQIAIVWWKKNRPSQYHLWSLAGLWIFPSATAIYLHNWRFVIFCFAFTAQAGYIYYLTRRRPMNADDPQFIYRCFLVVHRLTLFLATVGFIIFILTLFVFGPMFPESSSWVLKDSILFMFYGGYFGVMQRDFAQVVSDHLSRIVTNQIVVTRPGSGKVVLSNCCGLCGRELRNADVEGGGPAKLSPKLTNKKNLQQQSQQLATTQQHSTDGKLFERKLFKLKECGHEFHDECIRGWSVLGKRNMCPTCNERCDTASILASSPWAVSSQTWQEFLDLLRMTLVWNPLIFVVAMFVLHVTGLDHRME